MKRTRGEQERLLLKRGGMRCVLTIGTDVADVPIGDYRPIPTEGNDIMRDTWT
jgi:hypothetical protein